MPKKRSALAIGFTVMVSILALLTLGMAVTSSGSTPTTGAVQVEVNHLQSAQFPSQIQNKPEPSQPQQLDQTPLIDLGSDKTAKVTVTKDDKTGDLTLEAHAHNKKQDDDVGATLSLDNQSAALKWLKQNERHANQGEKGNLTFDWKKYTGDIQRLIEPHGADKAAAQPTQALNTGFVDKHGHTVGHKKKKDEEEKQKVKKEKEEKAKKAQKASEAVNTANVQNTLSNLVKQSQDKLSQINAKAGEKASQVQTKGDKKTEEIKQTLSSLVKEAQNKIGELQMQGSKKINTLTSEGQAKVDEISHKVQTDQKKQSVSQGVQAVEVDVSASIDKSKQQLLDLATKGKDEINDLTLQGQKQLDGLKAQVGNLTDQGKQHLDNLSAASQAQLTQQVDHLLATINASTTPDKLNAQKDKLAKLVSESKEQLKADKDQVINTINNTDYKTSIEEKQAQLASLVSQGETKLQNTANQLLKLLSSYNYTDAKKN